MNVADAEAGVVEQPAFDLFSIGLVLWRYKLLILLGVVGSVSIGIYLLNNAVYEYEATLQVTPAQADSAAAMSSLSGLASLAGVSLPKSDSVSPYALYVAALKSRNVADELARDPEVMRRIFADQWDSENRRWRPPSRNLRAGFRDLVKSVLGVPVRPWSPPDAEDLARYIEEQVLLAEDQKRGFLTITYFFYDRGFAEDFARRLHETADRLVRRRGLARASAYINYLENRLKTTTVSEHRAALLQSLNAQERFAMMASSDVPFAAEPFGEVVVSSDPERPRPSRVLAISLIFGGIAGLGLAAAAHVLSKVRNRFRQLSADRGLE